MYKFVILFTLLGSTLLAQQEQQHLDIIGLTDFPVPAWPEGGITPATIKENYVFVDLAKNEYVLAYPENLGTDAFKDSPGKLKISRYDLLRGVAPSISVAITPQAPSKFKYSYTVSNGPAAKQSIDQWVLALPDGSADDAIKTPDGWFGIVQKGRTFKFRSPEWMPHGVAAIWSFHRPDTVIQPGSSRSGFELESDLRPGFTVAFLRKSESVDAKVTTHGNVPKEVKEQLDSLLQLEYDSKTVLTLAPKFSASADDHTVADDFIQGIVTLSRAGLVDLNSDFARNALNQLTTIKPGAAASNLAMDVAPKTPLETDLLNAMKIALRLK